MGVLCPVTIAEERLILAEFANKAKGPKGPEASVRDFKPIGGGFWQQAINLPGLKPGTLFQWTVPQKSSLGLLVTWISMFGYTGAGAGTFFGSEALDFSGACFLGLNRNGTSISGGLQPFIAIANQPVQIALGPADVFAVVFQRDPSNTGFVAPAAVNIVTGVRGYMVPQAILGRFETMDFINTSVSVGNAGTNLLPPSGGVY